MSTKHKLYYVFRHPNVQRTYYVHCFQLCFLKISLTNISDEEEQLWVWEYETDEGTHDLFMDINEEIRFRVIDESFTDLTPTGPEKASQDQTGNQEEKSPYSITVSNTGDIPVIAII